MATENNNINNQITKKLLSLSNCYDTHYLALSLRDHNLKPKEKLEVLTILDLLASGYFEILSYGLSPNPFGFCYEFIGDDEQRDNTLEKQLNNCLNGLNESQENFLKSLLIG